MARATAIEMVTTLAHSQHGRQYLAQQGIMDKISNMIRGAETDHFSSLYLPGEGIHMRSVQVGLKAFAYISARMSCLLQHTLLLLKGW